MSASRTYPKTLDKKNMPLRRAGWRARFTLLAVLYPPLFLLGCSDGSNSSLANSQDTASSDPDVFSASAFAHPAIEYRPWIRWWWPGGAVDPSRLEVELDQLLQAGFGGVEVQSFVRQLAPSELARTPEWGSPEFLAALGAASDAAASRGLGFDVTLGSAYPAGAPSIKGARAHQLLLGSVDIVGPSTFSGPLPSPEQQAPPNLFGSFDENVELLAVVAAQLIDEQSDPPVLDHFTDVRAAVEAGGWTVPDGQWRVFAVYQNKTHQLVKYAAYHEDSFVTDHLDRRGAEELIREVGDPILDAANAVDAVFVDSFELSAELPWTSGLIERFRTSKGYDPLPLLPLLFSNGAETNTGNSSLGTDPRYAAANGEERVREDYADVRGAAFLEEHLTLLQEWATRRGVKLRVQAHGGFANFIDGYATVDIPESEFFYGGGSYDFLKLAPSAAHIAGRRIVSAESFVALVPNSRSLGIEDFHLLAGRAASAGITRISYHGFTHRFIKDNGEDWYPWGGLFQISSQIDQQHPVWGSLPALNESFSRSAYALTRGRHAADVAWLFMGLGQNSGISIGTGGPRRGESELSRAVLNAGLVYDRVSPIGLQRVRIESDDVSGSAVFRIGNATYSALLIDGLQAADPELLASVQLVCDAGIPIVVVGGLPERARGWSNHITRDAAVAAAVERITPCVHTATATNAGTTLLNIGLTPALQDANGAALPFSPEHRKIRGGDLVLLFNESDDDLTRQLRVNLPAARLQIFDPEQPEALSDLSLAEDRTFHLEIPARRSRLIVFQR